MSENYSKLPSKVYENLLKEIVREKIGNENYEVDYEAGSSKGDNYLGELIRIKIKSKFKNFNLILKLPPQNEARREQLHMSLFFQREILFYDEVMSIYKKFQEDRGINIKIEGFYEVPLSYKWITEAPNEGIFLEDLKEKSFKIYPRKETFTLEHVILVVKALAKKHAISLCIKDQAPELIAKFKDLKDLFVNNYNNKNEITYLWVSAQVELAIKSFEKLDESDFKTKVLTLLKNDFFREMSETVNGKAAEPYSVICHGDCWNNNIMFRYDENGNVTETKLLDYQIMRYASPTTDLAYVIFACTSKSLRNKYYQDFIDTYYETLIDFAKRLGSNPTNIFPRKNFEDHLRQFSKYALLMTILVIPSSVSDVDDIPDMNELSDDYKNSSGDLDSNTFVFITPKTAAMYEERLLGIFEDMYDLGYIK